MNSILLENGSALLLESGDLLELEHQLGNAIEFKARAGERRWEAEPALPRWRVRAVRIEAL